MKVQSKKKDMEMEKLHNTIIKIQEKYKRDMNGRSGSSGVQNENEWDDVVSGSKIKNQFSINLRVTSMFSHQTQ